MDVPTGYLFTEIEAISAIDYDISVQNMTFSIITDKKYENMFDVKKAAVTNNDKIHNIKLMNKMPLIGPFTTLLNITVSVRK